MPETTYALAPEPTRATTSITLAFGLVNVPLSVYTATEATRVERKEFVINTDVPVGRSPVRKDTGAVIDPADVERRAQAPSTGRWVPLTDDEVMACTSPRGLAQILSFVPLNKIAGVYTIEGLAQVRPKRVKGKTDPASEKAFALLISAMRARKVAALVSVAMRGPARPALLMPNGDLLSVVPHDGVRRPLPMPDVTVTDREAEMAAMLIDTIGIDVPIVVDETAAKVTAYIEAKDGGNPIEPTPEPEPTGDLMDAMMASIEAAKNRKAAA